MVNTRWPAWLVHLYTGSGLVFAFLGMRAILAGDYRVSFFWMLASVVVDSTDGWLARRIRVGERLPGFDGSRLDDIVDYLSFVFLPVLLLYHAGRLPEGWGAGVACAMLLSSAYGFSAEDAKSTDHFFTGFPSYWNIAAFYLYAAGTPRVFNAVLLLVLCAFVFVRIGYVYPTRTPALRTLTVTMCSMWGAMLLVLIWQLPAVSKSLLMLSLFFPAYYTVLSLVLHRRRS